MEGALLALDGVLRGAERAEGEVPRVRQHEEPGHTRHHGEVHQDKHDGAGHRLPRPEQRKKVIACEGRRQVHNVLYQSTREHDWELFLL